MEPDLPFKGSPLITNNKSKHKQNWYGILEFSSPRYESNHACANIVITGYQEYNVFGPVTTYELINTAMRLVILLAKYFINARITGSH